MSKRICGFIQTCVTAAGMVAEAAVLTFRPAYYAAIATAIGIAVPAINDILLLFANDKEAKK